MGIKYHHINYANRIQIDAWLKAGVTKKEMAQFLRVGVRAIYKELERGSVERQTPDGETVKIYDPEYSEQRYQKNLRAKGAPPKITLDPEYAAYLEYKVAVEKYAPGAVLGEAKCKGLQFKTSITKPTFYRYIEKGFFRTLTNKHLPVKRNQRNRYRRIQRRPQPDPNDPYSIDNRPAEVETREEFGHWEMDCVVGKKGTKKTLLVLTERKTRLEILRLMKDHTAKSVVETLDRLEEEYGKEGFAKAFRTITTDRGAEFSDREGIERSCMGEGKRTKMYVCHPAHPWERGSNENQNRLVRRHFPKGCDFTKVTERTIRRVEKWINTYPRRAHNSGVHIVQQYS